LTTPSIFERDYYRRLYEIEEQHGWSQGMRDAMNALLRGPLAGRKSLRVLDVGCGTGYLLEYLRENLPLAAEPVGIDLSAHALAFCQQRGAGALAQASALELPFAPASFDLIICIDTLQHLSPRGADRAALAAFARLLRPGGLLYLRTNSARGHARLVGADPAHYRRYRTEEVAAMLREAGLAVRRATYVNVVPGAWGMLRETIKLRPARVVDLGPGLAIRPYGQGMTWVNQVMHGLLALEARLLAQGIDYPFGHSTAFVAQRPAQRQMYGASGD
jgi:SAM-dependent methyltransferase